MVGRRNEKVEKAKKLLNFFIELNWLSEEMKKLCDFTFFNSTELTAQRESGRGS